MPIKNMDNVDENAGGGGSGEKISKPGKYWIEVKNVQSKQGPAGEYWSVLCEVVRYAGPGKEVAQDPADIGKILFDNISMSERADARFKLILIATGAIQTGAYEYTTKDLVGRNAFVTMEATGNEQYPLKVGYRGWEPDYAF